MQADNFIAYGVCKFVLLGSPLGHPKGVPCAELSPQVTEGYFREASHNKQKIPQKNPSTSYAGPPPLSGEAYNCKLANAVFKKLDRLHK